MIWPEAALELAGIPGEPAHSGIYHFANSLFESDDGCISWYIFADQILKIGKAAGLPLVTKKIVPINYSDLNRPAPRPVHAVLNTEEFREITGKAPRSMYGALREYIGKLKQP